MTVNHDGRQRPFADVLRDLNRGRTHDELGSQLTELVAAVNETGRKGTLTLTIAVEPTKGVDGAVKLTDTVKLGLPKFDRAASLFFIDVDGQLTRDNPVQPALPLTDVSLPQPSELREVGR